MLTRHLRCRRASAPITNYGLVIAYSLGILERALDKRTVLTHSRGRLCHIVK
jgi:hypothetical protein